MNVVTHYITTGARKFGDGWNRFWFLPTDPLPLAVMRIGVGAIAIWLVASFSFDLLRYFGPSGFISVSMVEALYPSGVSYRFSYLDYASRTAAELQAVHYAGVAVLIAFTLGLWTRVTSVLSLIVFLSYFHRGPMLTSVGEPVVALLLFYLCLGPCGANLSLDAWRKRRRRPNAGGEASPYIAPPTYGATISTRLIQVHVSLIYFLMFCATLQYNAVWWNGTAVWWLIARPESCLLDLHLLYQHPYVINLWTTSLIFFYLAFALLIWNRTARPLLIVAGAFAWSSIALLTGLIPFCAAMFLGGLSFVSAEQWRACCSCCRAKSANA